MDPAPTASGYELVLSLHSFLRWVVLGLGASVLLWSLVGSLSGGALGPAGRRLGLAFVLSFDLQLLVGLALHFHFSPTTGQALADMGAAMKDPQLRFWALEHPATMILALIVVHLGRILAHRASSERGEHFLRATSTAIALALILLRTPFPLTSVSRPWLRLPF